MYFFVVCSGRFSSVASFSQIEMPLLAYTTKKEEVYTMLPAWRRHVCPLIRFWCLCALPPPPPTTMLRCDCVLRCEFCEHFLPEYYILFFLVCVCVCCVCRRTHAYTVRFLLMHSRAPTVVRLSAYVCVCVSRHPADPTTHTTPPSGAVRVRQTQRTRERHFTSSASAIISLASRSVRPDAHQWWVRA